MPAISPHRVASCLGVDSKCSDHGRSHGGIDGGNGVGVVVVALVKW